MNRLMKYPAPLLVLCLLAAIPWITACDADSEPHEMVVRGGLVFDGLGGPPVLADVAMDDDTISAIAAPGSLEGALEVDAEGLAVAPGFVNVLSWANESLLIDGRGQSDIRQGVTLEVMGEGWSMGPLNERMREDRLARQKDLRYEIPWTTFGEYMEHLEQRGVSVNVASFVGATTVRVHEIGYEDRPPSAEELDRMQELVRQSMREGALGVGSSLIYAPAFYADTDELVALAAAAGEYGGMYISHLRSEGTGLLKALEELIEIARRAGVPAQVYHLKAAGRDNWPKLDSAIARIEAARAEGLEITADMYTYTAGATGLDASMPPWVQEGGYDAWAERLADPVIRARVAEEMRTPTDEWENFFVASGSPDKILLVGFSADSLKPLTGRTLAEVAEMRGTSPAETAMDLVIQNGADVGTVYFLMSEENVRKKVAIPWVAFDSDEAALAPEGVFLESNPHPRAYGSFARLLGRYVRDEGVIPLEEAIRRLTSFPAETFGIERRGVLTPGAYADIVVFDPETIEDRATFAEPHQYAVGVRHVFVNGVHTLEDGAHTGATAGRFVHGPGWSGD
ncbi:MAG: D-aminoacylase [marine benthic group bacterium]|nr:D-aminoacylase [Gemmatimonadota bacterium]MCL7990340.1 D-aminoacylase [Gemmatimonadota bacterium]